MESIKIKIALMGLGSAGTRHAIALSHFPEITIVSVVDGKKKNSYDLLQNKYKTLLAANYYDDDDKMFTQEYFDAIVVSADPISTMGEKPTLLLKYDPKPTLWERPLGFLPEHTANLSRVARGTKHSIINFDRYSVLKTVYQKLKSKEIDLGEIKTFNAFISLSIPSYSEKPWRYEQTMKLPVHLFDHIIDTFYYLDIPKVQSTKAISSSMQIENRTIDSSWAVTVKLQNGAVGCINAIQYQSSKEYLHQLANTVIIGTNGVLKLELDKAKFISNAGLEINMNINDESNEPFIEEATSELTKYLISEEGYTENEKTKAEALSIVKCNYDWVQSLLSEKHITTLGTIESNKYCLEVSNLIVASSIL